MPSAAADFLVLIALIVVAVIMGKPLSYLKCSTLSELGFKDATVYAFSSKLSGYIAEINGKIGYQSWIGASKAICLETKAIWGLSIALWLVQKQIYLKFEMRTTLTGTVSCFFSRLSAVFACGARKSPWWQPRRNNLEMVYCLPSDVAAGYEGVKWSA